MDCNYDPYILFFHIEKCMETLRTCYNKLLNKIIELEFNEINMSLNQDRKYENLSRISNLKISGCYWKMGTI